MSQAERNYTGWDVHVLLHLGASIGGEPKGCAKKHSLSSPPARQCVGGSTRRSVVRVNPKAVLRGLQRGDSRTDRRRRADGLEALLESWCRLRQDLRTT